MYSELIYTRCGEGFDMSNGLVPVKNSGFKVYAYSEQLITKGTVDLPLLYSVAQSKGSYNDPTFMDDAYLYIAPDIGDRILLSFHPIPSNKDAQGNYSHRPGNYINQVLTGRFDDFYPYEIFGSTEVWDAKLRGEAYYYENTPTPLQPRDSLEKIVGEIGLDDIATFIADGRQAVLMNAVAFIVAQYSLPPEKRKYLVIRDATSRELELWIAAIESAFSPRMASGLSFATRLSNFSSSNKYTVNLSGQYQTQINLQSPNQKLRFRAMIVGVDERDKANSTSVKTQVNLPYVVLDGKTKTLRVTMDTSNPYYSCITRYDEEHGYFCRSFLQMLNISEPCKDVQELFSAYACLSKQSSHAKELLPALTLLSRFQLINTPCLNDLYTTIRQCLPTYLQEDPVSAISILDWLKKAATVIGDTTAEKSFGDYVCRFYADRIYRYPQSKATMELRDVIMGSKFASEAAEYLTKEALIANYNDVLNAYSPADWVALSAVVTECLHSRTTQLSQSTNVLLIKSVEALYQAKDVKNAGVVTSGYYKINASQAKGALLADANRRMDGAFTSFVIHLITIIDPATTTSEDHLIGFNQDLQAYRLESFFSIALLGRAKKLTNTAETERFLDWMLSNKECKNLNISDVLVEIDQHISITDHAADRLAAKVQACRPETVACIYSAHLYALQALKNKKPTKPLAATLTDLALQGFPSIQDDKYADELVNALLLNKIPEDAFAVAVTAASRSAFYANAIAKEALCLLESRNESVVISLFNVSSESNSRILYAALVEACANMKHFEKGILTIKELLNTQCAQQFFSLVEREARELYEQREKPSILKRLFSRRTPE